MWVLLTLLTAVCTALRDAASKQATRWVHPVVVGFWLALIPAVALGVVVLVAGVGPHSLKALGQNGFVPALIVSGTINAVATPLIVWALGRSDLSLVAPLTSLTPLFMLVTGALILGERPSPAGGIGVSVIVVGAYLLNLSDRRISMTGPLLALFRDPGARAMLLVAFLYSISAAYDKVGVEASSPVFWAAAIQATVALALAPLAARTLWRDARRQDTDPIRPAAEAPANRGTGRLSNRHLGPGTAIALAGGVMAIGLVAQNTALTLTLAAYVIAVKRTSTLFGVLFGHVFFHEQRIRERAVGAVVMLAGFLLVTLA
jgi:drug/metabolite transporter (DMT)-like permease